MNNAPVLYPGSFDPVTLGHVDILERACRLFPRITVLVAESGKAGLLPTEQRVALFRAAVEHLPQVEVESFGGLLVDEIRKRKAPAVIRGIRTAGDYEHEWSLAGVNALLAPEIETVYFLARPETAAISSTLVRDVIKHGGDLGKLVPPAVARALTK
jgi:pantetheine-phosphate adenylyltransferase|nr:pantetheine-phosphate adenylyltransferase [Candidatus Krumholzibacteria bacterium]